MRLLTQGEKDKNEAKQNTKGKGTRETLGNRQPHRKDRLWANLRVPSRG